MPLISETMQEYHARKALSAGMAWQIVNDCPAQAWWESCFNPDFVRDEARHFDFGTAAHLAILEPHELARRIVEIDAENYRSKAAQEARDRAYLEGRVPLLVGDNAMLSGLRMAIEQSAAAHLFFGEGYSESSYTWEWDGVPCKARVDRLAQGHLIDLKTANSASPQAFQRAMIRDGHHLRAAWYIDGWRKTGNNDRPYLFVVVAKTPPHLVSVLQLDEQSIEWGRRLYRKALTTFRQCQETNVWPGYTQEEPSVVTLPAWLEFQYGALEDEDKL